MTLTKILIVTGFLYVASIFVTIETPEQNRHYWPLIVPPVAFAGILALRQRG